MPKRLVERCRPDSVGEFRQASRQRYNDGLALAIAGQWTGAIYVWGYTAEMVLKAAYFSAIGMAKSDAITWGSHLKPAIDRGKALGIAWPPAGSGHNIRAWAELLVLERARSTRAAPYSASFGQEVQRHGQRFEPLWRETLRYHRNRAYFHEKEQIRESAEWFLVNSHSL